MSNPILLGQAVTLQWCTTHGPSYLTFATSFMFLVYCGFAIYAIKWARWLIPLVTVTPYLKHLAQIVFQERRRLLSGWIYKKEKKKPTTTTTTEVWSINGEFIILALTKHSTHKCSKTEGKKVSIWCGCHQVFLLCCSQKLPRNLTFKTEPMGVNPAMAKGKWTPDLPQPQN